MSNFHDLKIKVAQRLTTISEQQLLVVDIPDRDTLVDIYLNSFTDLIERQYHNCNCCKSFLRQYGNIVSIKDGKLQTLWEVESSDYQQTVDALHNYLLTRPISGVYYTDTDTLGTDWNIAKTTLIIWEHFSCTLPSKYVRNNYTISQNEANGKIAVYKRSLEELTVNSCETVLELIAQNSLYRGVEFKDTIEKFLTSKRKYDLLESAKEKELFIWGTQCMPIRNSAIGTLLLDLSEGIELNKAVAKFEQIVAPINYKRTTALVTPSMIEEAKKTVEELNLTSALYRRYAVESDIPVEQMLFVDRSFKKDLDVFAELTNKTPVDVAKLAKVEEVTLNTFVNDILPKVTEVELLVENKHSNRFMVLTSAIDKTASNLFKWNNDLAWAYTGNVTDSAKERVKLAGGKTEGDLCCRLTWDCKDDLDFHMYEPNYHIYYGNLRRYSPNGGILDLDANGMDGMRDKPIENIVYPSRTRMCEGVYTLKVHNYTVREPYRIGYSFNVEIEVENNTYQFTCARKLNGNESITVAEIIYDKVNGFTILGKLPSTGLCSKEVWGIDTCLFHKVRLITESPNYLHDDSQGNKHYFFILENARSPEQVRGFFNEYLKNELIPHRKTFELLAENLKVEQSEHQLAGLGFSVTQHDAFIVRVSGTFNRLLKVIV